ncbi:MAG: LysR family transcriptional regulator [Bacteriovoracaceae bacterium]|jgi:DNA-binding transcriptional LysR family regulator|nr:LysR family transcriptional regulator [Bacteriovoracaceae bacterium]
MNISYDMLKSFVIFADSSNIYEAAKTAGISQPGMSQHLRIVESHFEKPLFTNRGKKKVLTNLGRELFEKLSKQFVLMDKALNDIERKSQDYSQMTMKIGARLGAIPSIIDNTLFPGNIQYFNMGWDETIDAINSGRADFCFSRRFPDSLDVISKKVVDIDTHFIVHKSLLKENSIEELKDHEFLQTAPFYTFSEDIPFMSDWCRHYNFSQGKLNTKAILGDWKTVIKLVQKKKGFTLCPSGYRPYEKDLVIIPVGQEIVAPLTWYLIYRKDTKVLFPVEECFDLDGIKKSLLSFEGFVKK